MMPTPINKHYVCPGLPPLDDNHMEPISYCRIELCELQYLQLYHSSGSLCGIQTLVLPCQNNNMLPLNHFRVDGVASLSMHLLRPKSDHKSSLMLVSVVEV